MRPVQHVHETRQRVGHDAVSHRSTFQALMHSLSLILVFVPFGQIAHKVKHFYREYARNRHKMTTITPSYHAVGIKISTSGLIYK